MVLQLKPMTPSDIPSFVALGAAAFRSGMASLLHPEPHTPEQIQSDIDRHLNTMKNETDAHYLKVVDSELVNDDGTKGKMIAGAKWRINLQERSEEVVKAQMRKIGEDEKVTDAYRDFSAWLEGMRWKWMGTKPFFFLHILCTHPDHHRRGAGGMLVRWGIEQADKEGLPTYLEASEAGKPLYERLGFEEVEVKLYDLSKYGAEGIETNTVMIRKPRTVDGTI
ncbi:acyl-CoA N-acyltransferase [Westerdykella ornata]|uniref:Acyl-CoA N-acyltransferase n=1 Tax=Westerdykella ornata TaxID=318751 RepID=A0A6A6JX30_WESOR|nr:acyl-CoA N-acyltransferase [Westerdykella ornata]KAF2280785.1 acyl-CoA N-acyltransferase [Westerdykella ornata]